MKAKAIHAMASGVYPVFESMPPTRFLRLLAAGEIATGAALLTPTVSTATAGAALTGFSGALVGLYAKTPGMRKDRERRGRHPRAPPSARTSGCSPSASPSWPTASHPGAAGAGAGPRTPTDDPPSRTGDRPGVGFRRACRARYA